MIQLFNADDFPDITTGSFYEEAVSLSTEFFMRLDVTTLQAESEVKSFGISQRGCLFREELFEQFAGYYSYSECLLKCRIRSIIALCSCIPFFMPTNFPDGSTNNVVQCTLQHIFCLNRYRVKWRTNRPILKKGAETAGLEEELEDSLSCPDCYPLCTAISYRAQTSSSIIPNGRNFRPMWGLVEDIPDITNLSIVRIYFPSPNSVLYKKDVVLAWYEIVSNFGGMLGLCMGFSIFTVIEILYFLTVRLYENITPENSKKNKKDDKLMKNNNMFKVIRLPNYNEIELKLGNHYNDKNFQFLK